MDLPRPAHATNDILCLALGVLMCSGCASLDDSDELREFSDEMHEVARKQWRLMKRGDWDAVIEICRNEMTEMPERLKELGLGSADLMPTLYRGLAGAQLAGGYPEDATATIADFRRIHGSAAGKNNAQMKWSDLHIFPLEARALIELGEYRGALRSLSLSEAQYDRLDEERSDESHLGTDWKWAQTKPWLTKLRLMCLEGLRRREELKSTWRAYTETCQLKDLEGGALVALANAAQRARDETFLVQLGRAMQRYDYRKSPSYRVISRIGDDYKSRFGHRMDSSMDWLTQDSWEHNQALARLHGLATEGEGLRLHGRARSAIPLLRKHLRHGSVTRDWQAMDSLARCYEDVSKPERAIDAYARALDVLERQRSALTADSYKRQFLDQRKHPYDRLVVLLADDGQSARAFHVAEQAKARSLLDLLEGKIVGKTSTVQDLTKSIRSASYRLRERRMARTGVPTDAATSSSEGRKRAQRSLTGYDRSLRGLDSELATIVSARSETWHDVATLLDDGTALVEYYVTPEESVVFVVWSGRLEAIPLGLTKKGVGARVAACRASILADKRTLTPLGQQLYREIMAPALEALPPRGIVRLCVVPHGDLHLLPFAALHDGDRWLIERYELVQLPSASVLRYCRAKRNRRRRTLLAFGNPTAKGDVPSLPASEIEVREIAELFGSDAKVMIGREATETSFRESQNQYDIIHLACHADFVPMSPSRSGLILAPDAANDGRLELWEIMQTPLNASFVTMSACETAVGQISAGDDVLGLSRGMLYAGTPSLMGSLWRVDDAATAQLMTTFYERFRSGDGPCTALRAAQLEMLRRAGKTTIQRGPAGVTESQGGARSIVIEYSHPYFWAPFVVIGDWQ